MTETRLMSAEDVAEYLGLNARVVSNKAAAGEIKGFKVGNKWRFDRADVEAYVEAARKKQSRASSEA